MFNVNCTQVRLLAMECIVRSRSGVESFTALEFNHLLSAIESNMALDSAAGRQNFMALINTVELSVTCFSSLSSHPSKFFPLSSSPASWTGTSR